MIAPPSTITILAALKVGAVACHKDGVSGEFFAVADSIFSYPKLTARHACASILPSTTSATTRHH
ncbi:MAG: hypothetical protein ABIV48_03720 [Pyrinomonadaceae bacterium]